MGVSGVIIYAALTLSLMQLSPSIYLAATGVEQEVRVGAREGVTEHGLGCSSVSKRISLRYSSTEICSESLHRGLWFTPHIYRALYTR